MSRLTLASLVYIAVKLSGCTSLSVGSGSFDRRPVSIVSFDLFNQRAEPDSKNSWRGDWLFRRERLLLIDRYLRDRKPDLLLLQGVLSRIGSYTENDLKIVGQGGLEGYDFDSIPIAEYPDTGELESLAVAVGLPLQLVTLPASLTRMWKFNNGGILAMFLVELGEREIAIFSLRTPEDSSKFAEFIQKVDLTIDGSIKRYGLCPSRVLLYGYFSLPADQTIFRDFLDRYSLQSISEGYCEIVSDCYTASPSNEIFNATSKGGAPAQLDFIYVSRYSRVNKARVILNKPEENSDFYKAYGQEKLWPTERFGWLTQVQFSRCQQDGFFK